MMKRDNQARQSSKLKTEEKMKKEEIKEKNDIALQNKLKKEKLERTLPPEDLSWADIKEQQELEREIRFQKKIQDLANFPPTGIYKYFLHEVLNIVFLIMPQ